MTSLLVVAVALTGAAIGSFLNVVIHRVPRGESIVRPRSRCPACDTEIEGRDNIPVVSWLLLRGRCRHCSSSIDVRYPLIETSAALIGVAAVVRFPDLEQAAFTMVVSWVLLSLAVIDLEHRRLPNSIVLPGIAGALAWVGGIAAVSREPSVVVISAVCGVSAFVLFLLIAVVSRGMGFGDVKLAAFVGVVAGRFGWEVAVAAVMGSFFAGGLAAVTLLVVRRAGRKTAVPFGPALAVGTVSALFAGPAPVRAWLGM